MTRLDREKLWAATHMKRLRIPDREMQATFESGTPIESTAKFVHMIWKTRHAHRDARVTAQLIEGNTIKVTRIRADVPQSAKVVFGSTLEAALWVRVFWRMGYDKA